MRKIKSYRFEEEIIEKVKEIAKENHRTLTNQIEVILLEYCEKHAAWRQSSDERSSVQ